MKSIILKITILVCVSIFAGIVLGAKVSTKDLQPASLSGGEITIIDTWTANQKTDLDPNWISNVRQGMAEHEYHAGLNAEGLQAPNRVHNLRTYFDDTGIHVSDRTTKESVELLGLKTLGMGRGEVLSKVEPKGVIHHDKNRVEIRRVGFTEWYINSEEGLEHGFTIPKRPKGKGDLRLELSVTQAKARLENDTVVFTTSTGRQLQYGGIKAYDTAGKTLPAYITVPSPDRLIIAVDDRGASYPIVVDPFLTATDGAMIESDQQWAHMGFSVSSTGDVNGDGYGDIIVGVPGYDNGESVEGIALVFLGSASGITGTNPSNAHAMIEGNQIGAGMGNSVASAGDVNGDGYGDIIVGATLYDNGETDEGAAFVFLGSASGVTGTNPSNAHAMLESNQADAWMGQSVASAGDVNGDGYDDVIVGVRYYDNTETDEGAAFVFLGSASGITGTNPSNAHSMLVPNQYYAVMCIVGSAGDVNDDGYDDIIVGAALYNDGETDEGAAFVFLGSASGVTGTGPSDAHAMIESNQAFATMGWSVASAGDVNGDGYDDIIVGAGYYSSGEASEGAAFVFLGSASGITGTNPLNAHAMIQGNQANAYMGSSVGFAGDVNGDGYDDVIVGAFFYNNGEADEGAAFVFLGGASGITGTGPSNAHAMIESDQASSQMGYCVASAGDVSGDGNDDIIIGAPNYQNSELNEGAAFVFLGSPSGIIVSPANHAPVANPQAITVDEDSTNNPIVLTGSDADSDPLTYTVPGDPANGTLTGTAPNLFYTPDANYYGTDTFTFNVNDGFVDSPGATVTITISPINDVPVANPLSVTIDEDSTDNPIVLTGSDADGDPLSYNVTSNPSNGTLSGTAQNLFYTPDANYAGTDTFTFRVNDGTVNSNNATVSITISATGGGGGGDGGGGGGGGCFISTMKF
ncbi:MAG: FG-GAP repeat protein [Deltaproteobacteria bacterium]|nr:FG-GAP repeat protein [Deltaproteobacteria bacterium]